MDDLKPMLAQAIDLDDLLHYAHNDDYSFQLKLDGVRIVSKIEDGIVTCYQRDGKIYSRSVPHRVVSELAFMLPRPGVFVFDGELLQDGTYWIFDCLRSSYAGNSVVDWGFTRRFQVIHRHYAAHHSYQAIRVLDLYSETEQKLEFAKRVVQAGAEGIIVRSNHSPYFPGQRTNALMKFKVWRDVDCIVVARNTEGKVNADLAVYDEDGNRVPIGSCSMLGKPDAQVDDVVEVRYLYFTGERLYQPSLQRIRTSEKSPAECTLDQLVPSNSKTIVSI